MGRKHGMEMRQEIRHNLEVYYRRFKNETQLSREEVAERASKYHRVIQNTSPDYSEMMRGVADGSGSELVDIVALNVRYELMYSQFSKIGAKTPVTPPISKAYGCTTFAALPEIVENEHLLMGENWDWIPEVECLFVRTTTENGGPDVLCFTEAGVVGGKIGLNSRGLGLMINGLVSNLDDWSHLQKPFHVRCWEMLRSNTLDEAAEVVGQGTRSCSANFLLGKQDSDGQASVVDIESSPEAVNTILPENGVVAHTNHFCNPTSVGVEQVIDDEWRSTLTRYDRISHLLDRTVQNREKFTVDLVKRLLRDHDGIPDSVCRHPNPRCPEDERYKSVVSVVMDLHDLTLWATNGSPCESEYEAYRL